MSAWLAQLLDEGFCVMPGPVPPSSAPALSRAYDAAVASADPADVRTSSNPARSTRITDFVNRDPIFDAVYVYEPILEAARAIIGERFKLSASHGRTIEPGATTQGLHVDVFRHDAAWPLVGFILMVDAFSLDNGATRFVARSHTQTASPADVMVDTTLDYDGQQLACGPAGSVIVFNGSTWHGFTANRTNRGRRSVQGAFIPRQGKAALDHAARIRPETRQRIGPVARYLLDLDPV
jgi:ectoine hydroxylase-related dioxygenase (phytanoyl-CoA dioxygenase family)